MDDQLYEDFAQTVYRRDVASVQEFIEKHPAHVRRFGRILKDCVDMPEILTLLLDHGIDINSRGTDDMTALHAAVENGQIHTIHFLISRGADVNAIDAGGRSVMDVAAACWAIPDAPEEQQIFETIRRAGGVYDIVAAGRHGDWDRIRQILSENPRAIEEVPPDRTSRLNGLLMAIICAVPEWITEERAIEILQFLKQQGLSISDADKSHSVGAMTRYPKLTCHIQSM